MTSRTITYCASWLSPSRAGSQYKLQNEHLFPKSRCGSELEPASLGTREPHARSYSCAHKELKGTYGSSARCSPHASPRRADSSTPKQATCSEPLSARPRKRRIEHWNGFRDRELQLRSSAPRGMSFILVSPDNPSLPTSAGVVLSGQSLTGRTEAPGHFLTLFPHRERR